MPSVTIPRRPVTDQDVKHGTMMFRFLRIPGEGELAEQPVAILTALRQLQATGGRSCVPRAELVSFLKGEATPLRSKQEPGRVVSFYRNQLVLDGYLEIFYAEVQPVPVQPSSQATSAA